MSNKISSAVPKIVPSLVAAMVAGAALVVWWDSLEPGIILFCVLAVWIIKDYK